MNHNEIKEKLSEFQDNELSADETRQIEEHLAGCQECGDEVRRWKHISQQLLAALAVPESNHFVSDVMARINEEQETMENDRSFDWRWPTVGLAFASAMLAFALRMEPAPSSGALLMFDENPELSAPSSVQATPAPEDVLAAAAEPTL